jgi:hypothetical protein
MKLNLLLLILLINRVESICEYLNNNCVKEEIKVLNFLEEEKIICNSSYICPSAIFCSRIKGNIWNCGTPNMNIYKQKMRIELKECKYGIIKGSEKIYIEDKRNEFPILIILALIIYICNTLFKNRFYLENSIIKNREIVKINKIFKYFFRHPSIYDWLLLVLILNQRTLNRFNNDIVQSNV